MTGLRARLRRSFSPRASFSPEEQLFVDARIASHQAGLAGIYNRVSLAFNIVGVAGEQVFLTSPLAKNYLLGYHLLFIVIIVLAPYLARLGIKRVYQVVVSEVLMVGGLAGLTYLMSHRDLPPAILGFAVSHAYGAALIMAGSLVQIVSLTGRPLVAFTAVVWILASLGIMIDSGHLPVGMIPIWNLIGAVFMPFVLVFRLSQTEQLMRGAVADYRHRRQLAPAFIVRKSIHSELPLDELFAPHMRYCVCISTDWRSYQKTSGNTGAGILADSLAIYYDLCNDLLETHVPNGNYHADWIADELFVVIFGETPEEELQLVDKALAFSADLVARRPAFAQRYGYPLGIDVGIATGLALVGLMGPRQHKKATAIGEIPGRARRYQNAGKLLRHSLGSQDRVIFGPETRQAIYGAFTVREFAVDRENGVRDLESTVLLYVEPTAGEVKSAA